MGLMDYTAVELGKKIKAGEVSVLEAANAAMDAINALEENFNCYVTVAIEAADVVFMNSEVKAIPQAIAIARATGAIAWQNVIFALTVKVIIMIAGLMGYASMWAAVFADTGVSLLCVLNSIRILYKKI